ncbi:hypothetical protein CkaCkLH20_09413 [Colletotrichum karsti]|uniref:Uncharacterized protein n=1 Tax=Colletotrichum karsti TaxID=1095194 RepID=A0A9P6I766_9PEZI|nr:uncharacterized protein CkaCkLH20_09413 [Colletotrichum karsti]KAF9873250.1 hypothetical protein CkaCkLH20_09413 [Colletotrichum karsti]
MVMMSSQLYETREQHSGFVDKTPYAHAYQSRFTEEIISGGGYRTRGVNYFDLKLLEHVNCSYLSTEGVAPTLLALKQHAQSLAILISQLTPTSQYAEVDNYNNTNARINKSFRENEAFDWLNDLNKPYENDDAWHQKPISDLMNKVRNQSDTTGTEHHCPLQTFSPDELRVKPRPYASHAALAMHANECLEMLDHEYGATGGLMSLLPTDAEADAPDMVAVRNSLLGQWLLFAQHLVARMHDLELGYANALDVTAGEAAVPMQMLSRAGPDGLSAGRELAYPQDKWVLANAGDDVFEHLHRCLDRQEAQIELKQEIWAANGTYGERLWNETRGGDLYARGLVFYDVKTRFYRLQGKGRSTIFMLPAHGEHPAVAQTRRLEAAPTVVSVVTPTWPARVSEWEGKYKARLDEATRTEIRHHEAAALNHRMREHNETLASELERARFMNRKFEEYYTASEARDGAARLERRAAELEAELQEKGREVERLRGMKARLEQVRPGLGDSFRRFLFEEADDDDDEDEQMETGPEGVETRPITIVS